jgi:isopentenyl diphosphate isomerase/L-lactate dehydrogenase-like FMN-dependent dehydrogenase
MDSGIRRAADVLKARALGATAVLLGRPYAYALAAAGEAGVLQVIRNLMAEIDLELALSGRRSLAEVDRSLLDPIAPGTNDQPT